MAREQLQLGGARSDGALDRAEVAGGLGGDAANSSVDLELAEKGAAVEGEALARRARRRP